MLDRFHFEDRLFACHLQRAIKEKAIGHFKLKPFDNLIDGIHQGRFHIIMAEPGGGKTTLFGQLVDEAAAAGCICVVNTLEIAAHQWISKSLSRLSSGTLRVNDISNPAKNDIVKKLAEKYEPLTHAIMFIEEPLSGVALGALIGEIQHETDAPVLLFHDYIQITPSQNGWQSSNDERMALKEVVSGLRHIANAYDVAVFAISSINRANYHRRSPCLDALGGTSAIEYSADTVLYLSAEEQKKERDQNSTSAIKSITIQTLKNRYGAKGFAQLIFDAEHATFSER